MAHEQISPSVKTEAAAAILVLRQNVQRKTMGHLPSEFSIEDYNGVIQNLAQEESCVVYLYQFGSERYYATRGLRGEIEWLAITTRDGRIETAFPPDKIDEYLKKRGFVLIGTVQEVLA